MPHTLPDVSLSPETTKDPIEVAAMLHAASAYLAAAFQLLRHEAAEARYEAQALIYLAREEIEAAVRKPGEEDKELENA